MLPVHLNLSYLQQREAVLEKEVAILENKETELQKRYRQLLAERDQYVAILAAPAK
jgi:vacuolar-type H+-ATPase subunit D/Vma8